jgi:hypothetical protein
MRQAFVDGFHQLGPSDATLADAGQLVADGPGFLA